jgi:L-arabinose isomerase
MQQGYGFAGEGDWKTAALLRIMKVMSTGLQGGTSFMEDYTYHFDNGNDLVLGSHMLEVCPTIATAEKPILDVQPLGIGGKADPARLIFNTQTGPAIVASLIDLGDRFRLLVNTIETVPTPHDLPKLPVANALWKAQPDLPPRRSLDHRRRRAPYRLQPRAGPRRYAPVRRAAGYRADRHR